MNKWLKVVAKSKYHLLSVLNRLLAFGKMVRMLYKKCSHRMDKYIHHSIRMSLYLLIVYWFMKTVGMEVQYLYLFITLVISILGYDIVYTIEGTAAYINKSITFIKLIKRILIIVCSVALLFANIEFCIYDAFPNSFVHVSDGSIFETYVDFLYYSFGTTFMNNVGAIEASSIGAKIVVMANVMTSFVLLVVILANYENIGQSYKEYIDLGNEEPSVTENKKQG